MSVPTNVCPAGTVAKPLAVHGKARRGLCRAGLALCLLLAQAGGAGAEDKAAPVAVTEAEARPIVREERVTGTVTSPRAAALSTQVGGMVSRLTVEAGDRVDQGETVVELDRELAAHALDTARAEARRAEAVLANARRRLDEGRRLVDEGSIPQSDFEDRAAAERIAVADLAAARAEASHQAAVVARYRIGAPFAGVIARRVAELGEWLEPGDTVVELVATGGLRFDFRVPQELYPLLAGDTRVTVRLDALPERDFAGRIEAIVPVSDPGVRTFLLRVVPADAAHPAITPGMSARGVLAIDTGRHGVTVPRDALLRYPDGRVSVWLLERSGDRTRARERFVGLGLTFGDRVEIREGLEAGATVVVEGNEALEDGQAVRVRDGG